MKGEKRYLINIKKRMTTFILINGRRVRTPVKFVALESEIPLIKSKLRMEEVTDYEITEIINDNKLKTKKL